MTPVSDQQYFPSLGEVLTGEKVLLSWRLVAKALTDETSQRQESDAVQNFLGDTYVQSMFKDPSSTFAPPNDAFKRDFETKTAPINVTSASNKLCDIEQIKQDADWLSKNARLNLVAALRVVIIAFQSRARQALLGPLSSQDVANLKDVAGLSDGQGSSFLVDLGAAGRYDADEISANFDKPETRQRRLFTTYLSERRYFLMAADYVHSIRLYGRLPSYATLQDGTADSLVQRLAKPAKDELETLLPNYFQAVTEAMAGIESGVFSITDDKALLNEEIEVEWLKTVITEVVHAFSIVFQLVDSFGAEFPPSNIVNRWFSVMETYNFFDRIQAIHPSIEDLLLPIKTLAATISILLLQPNRSREFLIEREDDPTQLDDAYDSYLLSSDVLDQIHRSVMNAASSDCETALPVIYTWTILLYQMNVSYQARTEKRDTLLNENARDRFEQKHAASKPGGRRNSAGSIFSIESSKFDGFLEAASLARDTQLVEQLATSVTAHGRVYDVITLMASSVGPSDTGSMTPLLSSRVRLVFLELLKVSYPFVGYQAEPVSSLIALLAPGRNYWDVTLRQSLPSSQDILALTVNDDYAMRYYFQQALDRYPYEFTPLISLCRSLCSSTSFSTDDERASILLDILRKTPTFTFHLPDTFQDYELHLEDENTNSFSLTKDIPLVSLSSSWSRRYIEDDAYRLPAGTMGHFLTDTGRVVIMDYEHSALSLLGRQMEISLSKEGYRTELQMLGADDMAEVISLFAILIRAEHIMAAKEGTSDALVQAEDGLIPEMSKHISGGRDIVTVVCETMDYYMQDDSNADEEAALTVLTSCITFLDSILPSQPSRIWSYLARCDLLKTESSAGKLTKLIGNLDLVSVRYDFLLACVNLFSDLIDTALASSVQRRASSNVSSRQRPDTNPWLGTVDKVLARVTYSIAQASVDIFENTSIWRFGSEINRIGLLQRVIPVLDKTITYSYTMGDPKPSDSLTACLRPAAAYIIDAFLSPSTGTLRFQPLLTAFIQALNAPESTLYPKRTTTLESEVVSSLAFATTLLRVSALLGQSSVAFETYLFKSSTLLARLAAASDTFTEPVLRLLDALVVNAGNDSKEPPSLMGYFGPHISKSFLNLLSALGQPFVLPSSVQAIWEFFASILKNRQQWMANCLLTGQTPREAMVREAKEAGVSNDSVFAAGLAKLEHLGGPRRAESLAVLEFVSCAQNFWPWTVFTLQKDTSYLDWLRKYVQQLRPSAVTARTDPAGTAQDARIAAYVAEILAMQLYHSRHLGGAGALAKSLVSAVDYYLRDGADVAGYNKSLHVNFERNFAQKYAQCSLNQFKRTALRRRLLGNSYCYDLEHAEQMLSYDAGWLGRHDNGFKREMELANANFSLVDAQIALFHSWEFLLLEMNNCLSTDETTIKHMLQVAHQCLTANQLIPGTEAIFVKLMKERANFALILIQRLVKHSLPVGDVNQLLSSLLSTITAVDEPFLDDSIDYYRILLKALFVTLRAYRPSGSKDGSDLTADLQGSSVSITQTILNVLDIVVGKGFRTLVSLIHEQDSAAVPEDLVLLTAILQACLSLPGVDQSSTQVLNIMSTHDAMHAATSLFSWSDKLSDQGDPVYGELSILFLLELSSLPQIAEQLASDGVLSSLLSSNLSKFMLSNDLSPYSEAPIAQRCYTIWAKGFLPLMLNMLTALGATVAPEISYVLNQFPHLLQASIQRFEAPGASRTMASQAHFISVVAASELNSLALLTRVIATLRVNNSRDIPDVEWDGSTVLENIEFWLSSRKLLRERLLPMGERQMVLRNTRTEGQGGSENLLEDKVVMQLEIVRGILSDELDA